jgi:5-methylcytosine-specific restriction endonuclease McrA
MKICKKCQLSFEGAQCKPCKNFAESEKNKKNPDKKRQKNMAYYSANKAKVKEYQTKNKEKITLNAIHYRLLNKENLRIKSAKYYEENTEKAKLTKAIYRKKNKNKVNEICYSYRKSNVEKTRLATIAWRVSNPLGLRLQRHSRRARIAKAAGKPSKDIYDKLMILQKGTCVCCRVSLKDVKVHIDHIVPLSKGGTNDDLNMQLLCQTCNNRKHAKHPIDFMQENGYLL